MFNNITSYIPLATTLFSLYFLIVIYKHWSERKGALYIFWWMLGVFFYGAGTATESINTLYGFSTLNFRLWYILGALLGGAPLAQGTVYFLLKRPLAHILTIILVSAILVAAILVLFSPLHPELMSQNQMSGRILDWHFIVYIVPFINIYAFAFLVGGAIYSAIKYANNKLYKQKFIGNILIAFGGLLPGIGGSFTRYGYVEILYITEFVGIILIYIGYNIIRHDNELYASNNSNLLNEL